MEQEVHRLNTPKLVYWERQGRYQTANTYIQHLSRSRTIKQLMDNYSISVCSRLEQLKSGINVNNRFNMFKKLTLSANNKCSRDMQLAINHNGNYHPMKLLFTCYFSMSFENATMNMERFVENL